MACSSLYLGSRTADFAVALVAAVCRVPSTRLCVRHAGSVVAEETPALLAAGKETLLGCRAVSQYIVSLSDEVSLLGDSDMECALVTEWSSFFTTSLLPFVDTVKIPQDKQEQILSYVDRHLLSRTYLAASHITVADLHVFSGLHPIISSAARGDSVSTSEYLQKYLSVTRWFDHIQRAYADAVTSLFPRVFIKLNLRSLVVNRDLTTTTGSSNTDETPATLRTGADKPVPLKKANLPKDTEKLKKTAASKDIKPEPMKSGKDDKKKEENDAADKKKNERKEKRTIEQAAATAAAANVPVISQLDIRVGKIVSIKQHDDADSLYVEQIDLGEETGPRTIVSGLVKYCPINSLDQKMVVVLCNLKPANMRGVKSQGMVLCASDEGKATVEPLLPPSNSVPGDKVSVDGFVRAPVSQLNPKKKIWESVQPELHVNTELQATFQGKTLLTDKGIVTAESISGGNIS